MDLITQHSAELVEFVQDVQHRAGLERYAEAQQLSSATLSVLGEAISQGQAADLARWLPAELADQLSNQTGHAGAIDHAKFLDKVSGMIHTVDIDRVGDQVAAVLQALRASAPSGELDDTIAQLPPAISAMFERHP